MAVPKKSRPRVSLQNLMLLMTIAAMAIALWRLNGELAPLRAEVRDYRDRLGILRIGDADLVHALRLPTEGDEPRKYRVYLPEGHEYWFHYRQYKVPARGVAKSSSRSRLEPGEHLFSIKFDRRRDSTTGEPTPHGSFRIRIESQDEGQPGGTHQVSVGVSQRRNNWIVDPETGNTSFGWKEIGRTVERSSPDEALVLYRARAYETVVHSRDDSGKPNSWGSKDIPGPCEGFMMWISTEEEHP